MAGAVALASTGYIAAIDEKAWAGPRRLGPGVQGSPQREPALPGDSSRAEYARRKVEVILLERGLDRSPVAAAGTGCSPANVPLRRLRRLARPCVLSIALPLRFYYDFTETSAKNLWGAYASNVIRTY